jgi:hypothetical protein
MTSMPENPPVCTTPLQDLLVAAEHELTLRRREVQASKSEVRRLRRRRRRDLVRAVWRHIPRIARIGTRSALVLAGMVAFGIGGLQYLHDLDGGTALGAAAAAWGLAAMMRPRR